MANLTIVEADVAVVEEIESLTAPVAAAVVATLLPGCTAVLDSNGEFVLGDGSEAATQYGAGLCVERCGRAAKVLYQGLVNLGDAITALAFNAKVYLSDDAGLLANGTGTVSHVVGRVVSKGGTNSTTNDKLLRLIPQ